VNLNLTEKLSLVIHLLTTIIYLPNTADAFTQFKFAYQKIDFYLAQSYTRTNTKEGLYRNGLYQPTHLGKSSRLYFENFGLRWTYTNFLEDNFNLNAACC
jgi:hypothetical protein